MRGDPLRAKPEAEEREEEDVKYLTAIVHAISVFVSTDWPGSR